MSGAVVMGVRVSGAVVAIALLAGACGESTARDDGEASSAEGSTEPNDGAAEATGDVLPFGLRRCTETPLPTADPDLYRDEPVYASNEQPIRAVHAWAVQQPHFEEIWIDREHRGWLAVGFTDEVEMRQEELDAEFPDVGVVAVEVDHSRGELERLHERVAEVQQANGIDGSSSHDVPAGIVTAWVGVFDAETLAPFAEFAGEPVCFDGLDPEDAVPDGAQPTGGANWRLLAAEQTGPTYRTGVATTYQQYERLWGRAGLSGDLPAVDLDNEIVVWFGAVYGGDCPIRLDDVVVADGTVHGEFVLPGNPSSCTDDANPQAYVVAIDRQVLPSGPFEVQLDGDHFVAEGERTVVDVDLRTPGSTATSAEIHAQGPSDPMRQYAQTAGGMFEEGFPDTVIWDLGCGVDVIGPFNDLLWSAESDGLRGGEIPPPWSDVATSDGEIIGELLLEIRPPTVTLTVNGHAETYLPAPSGVEPPCDAE